MRILLVQSYLGGSEPPVFPLGLACIKASLNGHDVRVFDMNLAEDPETELLAIIEKSSPDLIGISLRNIDSTNKRVVVFYYTFFRETLKRIRELTDVPLVVGGAGFSIYAREIMEREPLIDYGVYLEGEKTFPALIENLDSPEKVPGVFYRRDGRVFFSGGAPKLGMEDIPLPDLDGFDIEAYKRYPYAFGVETKRGCALNCIYCIYGFLNGKAYRMKPPERVVDEIEALVKGRGIDEFTFVDSVFNIPEEHARNICEGLLRRGVRARWSAWFSEKGLTRQFVLLAREAGCRNFIFSPDGFSDAVLKGLGKNISRRDIERAADIFREVDGVQAGFNFFKNPPGQKVKDFFEMLLFCIRTKAALGKRIHFEFNSLRVEPHTALYEIALREGFVERGQSLLEPCYYTNPGTRYLERAFNMLLMLRGR